MIILHCIVFLYRIEIEILLCSFLLQTFRCKTLTLMNIMWSHDLSRVPLHVWPLGISWYPEGQKHWKLPTKLRHSCWHGFLSTHSSMSEQEEEQNHKKSHIRQRNLAFFSPSINCLIFLYFFSLRTYPHRYWLYLYNQVGRCVNCSMVPLPVCSVAALVFYPLWIPTEAEVQPKFDF